MIAVKLELEDWNRVLAILAQAPWATVNPLILAVGEQLRQQAQRPNGPVEPPDARLDPIRQ